MTYAQNREDIFLWALLGHRTKGFYVDVGSHDPEFHSVTKLFYDRGWHGINIEADPELNKTFAKARPRDVNLNVGISNEEGELHFRRYPHHSGLSTFSEGIMKLHEKEGIPHEDMTIPTRPLKEILEEYKVGSIDFLKIDVEGFEVEVIEGSDWEKYRPSVLVIEATVRDRLMPLLKKIGYKLEFFDGLNNYYLDTKATEPLTIYNYAPRILSYGYQTKNEVEGEKEKDRLIVEKDAIIAGLTKDLNEMKRLRNQPKNLAVASKRVARGYAKKLLPRAEELGQAT